ncbi:MAG: hypothetical protein HY287_06195 [Planctomycetes bacterium]|nr:hypothetical protein [Planctomycetota bacterium]MBI3833904.1 hypothetical protein [Planctomycetota bacterium]
MEPTIDALLDGLLTQAQVTEFSIKSGDSTVRAAMEGQKHVNASLNRLFASPAPNRVLEHVLESPHRDHRTLPGAVAVSAFARRFALAAVVALCIIGVWRFSGLFRTNSTNDPYQVQPWRSMDSVYHDAVAAGFKPAWVCKDEDEFASFFRRSTGSRLLLAEASPNVHTYGLSICNCITPGTLYLLARVENSEVLVFADRAARDPGGWKPATPGFHLFQRRIGDAVLYEFTQLNSPHLLDLFHLYDTSVARPTDGGPSRWQKDSADGARQTP